MIGAVTQFKAAKASMLTDPTLLLSVLQQLCGSVNSTGVTDVKAQMLNEVRAGVVLFVRGGGGLHARGADCESGWPATAPRGFCRQHHTCH